MTQSTDEIRHRIAGILGYCKLDGDLHNPQNFEKRFLRSRWKCPDCDTVVGEVSYKRAVELQWVLSDGSESEGPDTRTDDEEDEAN